MMIQIQTQAKYNYSIPQWYSNVSGHGLGKGTILLELFVDNPINDINFRDYPVGEEEPSWMAIGTEKDANNHQEKEAFDGELARPLLYETALSKQEMKEV